MKNKGDAVVALLVIACSAVLLLALYFAIGGNPFSKPHLTLTVDVEDAGGIDLRSDVTYAGQVVGEVVGIEQLSPDERIAGFEGHVVRLHVEIKDKVALPANLSARISSTSMLGENQLSLTRIDDKKGLLENGAQLVGAGGSALDSMIPGASDMIASLGEVIKKFGEVASGLEGVQDGQNISEALANIREASVAVKESFAGENGLPAIAGNLNEAAAEIRALIAGAGEDPGLKAQLTGAVTNIEELTEGWKETFGKEDGVNAKLQSIADGVDAFVHGNGDERALAEQMASITSEIETLSKEIQVFVVYAQYFGGSLAEKPRRLLFGDNDHLQIPSKEQIMRFLEEHGEPYPVDLGDGVGRPTSTPRKSIPKKSTTPKEERGPTKKRIFGQKRK